MLGKVDHEAIDLKQERGVYWLALGKEQKPKESNWPLCAGTAKPAKPAKPVVVPEIDPREEAYVCAASSSAGAATTGQRAEDLTRIPDITLGLPEGRSPVDMPESEHTRNIKAKRIPPDVTRE